MGARQESGARWSGIEANSARIPTSFRIMTTFKFGLHSIHFDLHIFFWNWMAKITTYTPPKTNISPLKDSGWKTILSFPFEMVPFLRWGGFLKWWYPQNTPKWSFLVGKPMVVGYHHFRKPPWHSWVFGGGSFWFLSCKQDPIPQNSRLMRLAI